MSYRIGEHQSDVVLLYAFSNPPGYLTRLASEVCDEIMLPDVLSARFEFSLLQINSSSLASLSLVHPVQDYAYIPSEALADRSVKLSQEYRTLIFFGDVKPFLELLLVLCGGSENALEYALNWSSRDPKRSRSRRSCFEESKVPARALSCTCFTRSWARRFTRRLIRKRTYLGRMRT